MRTGGHQRWDFWVESHGAVKAVINDEEAGTRITQNFSIESFENMLDKMQLILQEAKKRRADQRGRYL